MKLYLLFLFLTVSSFAYSQNYPHANQKAAASFIDSVRVSSISINYIKPDDIKDVFISKDFIDKATNVHGAIYITTKNPKAHNLIGLEEIKKMQGVKIVGTAIYMVDNQFIKDTQYFKLPSSAIHHITITKGDEFDNLKNELPNFSIVKIITNNNVPESKGMMIRGTSEK